MEPIVSQSVTEFANERPEVSDLTESERHRLLAAERRRLALTVLAERATSVELTDLAVEIAAREDGCNAADDETVTRIKITLHHEHLPKMADLGVIDYDEDSHTIAPS